MPQTLTTAVSLTAVQTVTAGLGTSDFPLALARQIRLDNGTGANQADKLWTSSRSLNASATEDLDLAGTLLDPFGATITFARIKGIYVEASAANTNNVVLGNAASNGFISWVGGALHTVNVRPGGRLLLEAPDAVAYVVTAATADLLHVANSAAGSSVAYQIALWGASA